MTRMTRIRRMTADQNEIRGHPPYPRHPRSYYCSGQFSAPCDTLPR
jgi:hypothetical protein